MARKVCRTLDVEPFINAIQRVLFRKRCGIDQVMHELGIVFHIIRTVEDVAKENHVARIQRVTLQLGEVSGVVESYLQDCWKWAAAKSEILPGAALTVEQIPAITLCEDCGQQYPTVPHGRTCPHCQSPHTHLLQGNEMMIKEVEAVEPETSEASG